MNFQQCSEQEFLQHIMKRPGMFVGTKRLDYIERYFYGWCAGTGRGCVWEVDYDIQRWLFIKYSASINASSLSGWNLFYRCFGIGEYAVEMFAKFIEVCPFPHKNEVLFEERVAGQLYSIRAYYEFEEELPNIFSEEEIKKEINFNDVSSSLKELVRLINRMIVCEYEKMYIYICHDEVFLQVRFYYDVQGQGWVDGVSLASQTDYYTQLLIVHGHINRMTDRVNEKGIVTVKVKGENIEIEKCEGIEQRFVLGNPSLQQWEGTFENQLQKWKDQWLQV